jgi:molybdenum cofactor cytidylyltransferase
MNEDLDSGPIGSIRAGIHALAPYSVQAALVWPADRPHVSIATIAALLDAFRGSHQPIVVPVFKGRRGHPVLFARSVFDELLAAPNDQGARSVVRRDPTRVASVEADDSSVLEDFNTPDDYKELLRREDKVRGD